MRNSILILCSLAIAFALGCGGTKPASPKEEGKHKAVHGGVLNALTTCENGHAEVKVDGTTMTLWFVGGGPDTDKSVRVPDKEFTLTAKPGEFAIVLKAKPNELAEEKAGDCSRFEGSADWLKEATAFVADGSVTFKGKAQKVHIEYPNGYDPD